jgi:hypothetical protein
MQPTPKSFGRFCQCFRSTADAFPGFVLKKLRQFGLKVMLPHPEGRGLRPTARLETTERDFLTRRPVEPILHLQHCEFERQATLTPPKSPVLPRQGFSLPKGFWSWMKASLRTPSASCVASARRSRKSAARSPPNPDPRVSDTGARRYRKAFGAAVHKLGLFLIEADQDRNGSGPACRAGRPNRAAPALR